MPAVPAGPRKIEKEEAKEMIAEMSVIVEDPANAEKIEAMKEQLKNVGDSTWRVHTHTHQSTEYTMCVCVCVLLSVSVCIWRVQL